MTVSDLFRSLSLVMKNGRYNKITMAGGQDPMFVINKEEKEVIIVGTRDWEEINRKKDQSQGTSDADGSNEQSNQDSQNN